MFKKATSILLAVLLSLSLAGGLFGCAGKEEAGSTPPSPDAPAGSVKEGSPVEIEFWFGLGGGLGDFFMERIDEYNASQDEVHVTGIQQASYADTITALQAAIASGTVPACSMSGAEAWMLRDRGVLEVLDPYIENSQGFDLADFMDSAMCLCYNSKEELIGLPLYASTQVMYYNKSVFEEAGLDPDEVFATWPNLVKAAETLCKKENGETVFYGWEPMYGSSNMIDAVYSAGGQVLSDDGKTVTITTPEWVDTWEMFRKCLHDDKTMRIHFGGEGWEYWYKTIDDVMQDRAAGYTGSSGDQGDLDFDKLAAHTQPGWDGRLSSPQGDGPFAFILADAPQEQKDAAFDFITYLTDKDTQCKVSMGTGYVAVRKSCVDVPEYAAFLEKNPQARVPFEQLKLAQPTFTDPTGGAISTALRDAADLVQIENVPAAKALADAQKIAQAGLDEYWQNK